MRILILCVCISFLSCKKEENEPNNSSNSSNTDCTCGVITDDGYDVLTDCFWLEVRNDCTDNKKKFCFEQDVWMSNFVGDPFCVYQVEPW